MKHDLLKDELASLSRVPCEMLADMICLQEEVDEWKSTAEEMRQDYEDTIYSLTPNTIWEALGAKCGQKVRGDDESHCCTLLTNPSKHFRVSLFLLLSIS